MLRVGSFRRAGVLAGFSLACCLSGCGLEGTDGGNADGEDVVDDLRSVDPSLCGGVKCPANESCGLVNFEESCVCGNEPHCSGGQKCNELASGRITCMPPVKTGNIGCGDGEQECAAGDLCIYGHTGTGGDTCMRLCDSSKILCDNGAYCIGLQDDTYTAPLDGVCNIGGGFKVNQTCQDTIQCVPEAFCIEQWEGGFECMYACRVGKTDCPGTMECAALVGETVLGACM